MNNFEEDKVEELSEFDESIDSVNENQDEIVDDETVQDNEPEEIIEVESEDENLSSDYSDYEDNYNQEYSNINFQNQRLQNNLRNFRKNNDKIPDKLKEEKRNQLNKNIVDNSNQISEQLKNEAKNKIADGSKELAKGTAEKGAKAAASAGTKATAGVAAEGTAAATGAAAEGAASGLAALASNPYFWIAVGIVLLVILVIIILILWAAYDGNTDGDSSNSSSSSSNIEYVEGYENCNSITVNGSGTFKLDEYIAGVVHAEHGSAPPEAKKALAVAARTYAIMSTNKCTKSIGNSSRQQNFSANYDDSDMTAASETSGQVLTYEGEIFLSEYDSWNCIGSSTCTYVRQPDGKKHTVTLSSKYLRSAAGGHGHGMSQLASADMADQGKKYDEILKYFYSDGIKISAITEEAADNTSSPDNINIPGGSFAKFNIRQKKPNWLTSPDKKYYTKTISSDPFQCVWYAKARIVEILSTMEGADEAKRQKAIETVKSATGHGSYWYKNAQSGGNMNIFKSSNDYTKPRPGAMISWKWTDERWSRSKHICSTENCGHVGVIESVDEENKTVVVSDGWKNCGRWSDSSCLGFRSQTWTFDQLKSYGGNYVFLGYVYVADYAKGG